MLRFILLDVVLVSLLEVLGQHDVAVLAHRLHARLLTDGVDVGARNLVGPEIGKNRTIISNISSNLKNLN